MTVAPVLKSARSPFSVAGRLVTLAQLEIEKLGELTVRVADWLLSAPSQLLSFGVTEYFQSPGSTLLSVQLSAEIVPEHADPIDCSTPLVLYRLTR